MKYHSPQGMFSNCRLSFMQYEDAASQLKVKEDELTVLRSQLENASGSQVDAIADTVSSDGGETVVPDIDLSKIEAQVC